jgi:hypothetical protein
MGTLPTLQLFVLAKQTQILSVEKKKVCHFVGAHSIDNLTAIKAITIVSQDPTFCPATPNSLQRKTLQRNNN